MKGELVTVRLSEIDPNPHHKKGRINERRKAVLKSSVKDFTMFPGRMIGRRVGNRVQLATGRVLYEVTQELGLEEVQVLLLKLDDEGMLGLEGRESMEEFNTTFEEQYEVWEAAIRYSVRARKNAQQTDIARMLGWLGSDGKANVAARACDAAYRLIEAGHLQLADLEGLSVSAAHRLTEKTLSRIEMLAKLGKAGGRPAAEIESDQKTVADAGRSVAADYREGNVARRDITTEIDYRAVKMATKKDKPSPLFAKFAKTLADNIHKMLVSDPSAEKLAEMERALGLVSLEEDQLALKRIDFALGSVGETADKWRRRLKEPRGEKVVPFKLLAKREKTHET